MDEDDKMTPSVDFDVHRAESLIRNEKRIRAGMEYTAAIMSLGLDPDLMCWVYFPWEDRVELTIVTTMVDRVGPIVLYDLLFKAYDLSATPKDIDPFEVGIYSPITALGVDLINSVRIDDFGYVDWVSGPGRMPLAKSSFLIGLQEMKYVDGLGVFRIKSTRKNADQDRASLHKFRQNIENYAA